MARTAHLARWSLLQVPALVLLLLCTAGFVFMQLQQHATDPIELPLEVIGEAGHTEAVEVFVTDASVDSLYLRGARLAYAFTPELHETPELYDTKASFRINDGVWVDINNQNFRAFWPERNFTGPTGPIGGPWSVLRGMLSIEETGPVVSGANTIEFRFNGALDNESSGYYVVELDLRSHRDAPSALSNSFTSPDYTTWAPPEGFGGGSDIAAGGALWVERNRLISDPNTGQSISASCADCHFQDGSDLKHFNFSNQSIIARSVFHGLSQTEGKQIAAYIRSRDLNYPSGYDLNTCGGRPWNPPYQPGPGVDSNNRPGKCWSAGAGVEWVMDNDWDAIPYLFPDASTRATIEALTEIPQGPDGFEAIHGGPAVADLSPSSIRKEVQADSLIRTADVPVAVQFPVVHEWWPRIHPADATTTPMDFFSASTQSAIESAEQQFSTNRSGLISSQSSQPPRQGGLHNNDFPDFSASNWDWDGFTLRGDLHPRMKWYAKSIWLGLRKWDLMWRYDLEDLGDEIYRDHPSGLLGGQRLTWHQGGSQIYDMAPHKNMDDNRLEPKWEGPFQDWRTSQHYSTTWYQMSLMLESNQRGNQGNNSFDANYHHGHIGFQRSNFGWAEAVRYGILSTAWLYQTHNNYTGWHTGGWQHSSGWANLHQHWPFRYLYRDPSYVDAPQAEMDPIREEMTRQWLRTSMQYGPNVWREQKTGDGNSSIQPVDAVFAYQPGASIGGGPNKQQDYLNMVGRVHTQHDIAESLVDSMAHWGQRMWPRVADEFAQFHSTGFTHPTLTVSGIQNGQVLAPEDELTLNVSSDQPLDVLYIYRNGSLQEAIENPGTSVTGVDLGAHGEGVARWFVLGYTDEDISGYWGPVSTIADTGNLPDGWASTTVQNDFAARSISFEDTDDSFRIGRRGTGILNRRSQDDFPFLFRALTDDGSISFRIKDLPDANHNWRGGGVTVRSTLDVGSPHISWLFNPTQEEVRRVRRLAVGENNNADGQGPIPAWARIERDGDEVKLYGSSDGASWSLIDAQTFPSGSIEWIGFWMANRDFHASSYFWEVDSVTLDGPAFSPPAYEPADPEALEVSLTSPSDGALFTLPTQLSLEAVVNGGDPEDPVALVRFFVDGILVGEDEENAYAVTHEITEQGTYTLFAEAETEGGVTVPSAEVTITVEADEIAPPDDPPALPVVWAQQDIGAVDAAGSASYTDGMYTVSGSGADIWGTSDAFHYAHQPLVGDGEIWARITGQENTDPWAKAGIMFRGSGAPDAAHAMAALTPANGLRLQYRPSDGAGSSDVAMDEEATAPTWVRLTREGATVTAAFSDDGDTWTTGGSTTVALPDTVWAGLAVTSHADGELSAATFTDVSVVPSDVQSIEQVIQLSEGWNFIARTVTPETTSISTLLDAATSEILLVKNEAGEIYSPEFGIDDIGTWASDEAYMVYATEAGTLTLAGPPLMIADEPLIREESGWTYLPFTPTTAMPVEEALAPVADVLLVATDGLGGVYVPEFEINTIGELAPGQGLRAYFTAPVDFTYPVEGPELQATATTGASSGNQKVSSSGAILLIEGTDLPDGHPLGVYASDNRKVGQGRMVQGRGVVMVRGDDPLTPTMDGARPDEPLTVAYETAHGQQALPLASIANLVGAPVDTPADELRYTAGAVWAAQMGQLPEALALEQSYPNPMQTWAQVTFHLPEPAHVNLTVYDALGREVARLVDAALPAGTHDAVLDGRSLSSGVYFYRLSAGTQRRVQQLVVVR